MLNLLVNKVITFQNSAAYIITVLRASILRSIMFKLGVLDHAARPTDDISSFGEKLREWKLRRFVISPFRKLTQRTVKTFINGLSLNLGFLGLINQDAKLVVHR
jgi:hypothetical protein